MTFMHTTVIPREEVSKRKVDNCNKRVSRILMLRVICFAYILGKKKKKSKN